MFSLESNAARGTGEPLAPRNGTTIDAAIFISRLRASRPPCAIVHAPAHRCPQAISAPRSRMQPLLNNYDSCALRVCLSRRRAASCRDEKIIKISVYLYIIGNCSDSAVVRAFGTPRQPVLAGRRVIVGISGYRWDADSARRVLGKNETSFLITASTNMMSGPFDCRCEMRFRWKIHQSANIRPRRGPVRIGVGQSRK